MKAKVVQHFALDSLYYHKKITNFQLPKILNVNVASFHIRSMKTRWGSCTPKTRKVRLNLELAKRPPECLEYIVVHELVHLIESSHNSRFKALMDQFYPDWRLCRKELHSLVISS